MSASVVGCLFTSQDGTCVCVQHGYTVIRVQKQKQKHNKQLNHPWHNWHRTGEQESGEKISKKSLLSLLFCSFRPFFQLLCASTIYLSSLIATSNHHASNTIPLLFNLWSHHNIDDVSNHRCAVFLLRNVVVNFTIGK